MTTTEGPQIPLEASHDGTNVKVSIASRLRELYLRATLPGRIARLESRTEALMTRADTGGGYPA
jgi:hypothetical protein